MPPKLPLDEEIYYHSQSWDSAESRLSIVELALKYIIHKDKNPASFEDHGYLIEPMNDMHPRQVTRKAAQVGITTSKGWKTLALARKYGSRIAVQISFPAAQDAEKFSQVRFAEIVNNSPGIARMVMVTDQTKTTKQVFQARVKMINGCAIYFQGRTGDKQAISIDTNVVLIDERDFDKNDKVIAMLQGRVGHDFVFRTECTKGLIEEYSTPSMPGYGIDKIFQQSDQRFFYVSCTRCHHEFLVTFTEDCVNGFYGPNDMPYQGDIYWRCPKCKRSLDLTEIGYWDRTKPLEVKHCKWIPTKPENSKGSEGWHGYHMGKDNVAFRYVSPKELLLNRDGEKYRKYPARFKNQELGLPDMGSNQTISIEVLERNIKPDIAEWKRIGANTLMGVDQGCWLTVGEKIYGSESDQFKDGRYKLIHAEHIHEDLAFDTVVGKDEAREGILSQRIREFGCSTVVIDDQPNSAISRRLAAKFASSAFQKYGVKIWRLTSSKTNQGNAYIFDEDACTMTENRTKSLDAVYDWISHLEILFPAKGILYQHIDTTFYKDEMKDMMDLLFDHIIKETKVSRMPDHLAEEQTATTMKGNRSYGNYIVIGDQQNHLLHALKMLRIAMEIQKTFGAPSIILPYVAPREFHMK